MQFERTHLINDVGVIKRSPPPIHATHTHTRVGDDIKDILFVMRTNIMYYGPNCFCTLLYAHTRARSTHQI